MQDRPALGQVDGLASEHLVAHGLDARFTSQGAQKLHGLGGDAVLRVVEQQIAQAQREGFEARRLFREQLAHVQGRDGLVVGFEFLPGGRAGDAHGPHI
jgi:hypothetical protein